jgi:hypothetical protein
MPHFLCGLGNFEQGFIGVPASGCGRDTPPNRIGEYSTFCGGNLTSTQPEAGE